MKDLEVVLERIAPEFKASAKSFGVSKFGVKFEISNTKVSVPRVTVRLLVALKVSMSVEKLKLD